MTRCPLFLAILAAAALPASAGEPIDWPGHRGPRGDGISAETGLLDRWPEDGPERLWRAPLGSGFSGVAAVAGRLFTLYGRDGREIVAAFDAGTGREVWAQAIDDERKDRFGDGPRSTPRVADGVVYAVGASGQLVALRTADGSRVWERHLRDLGARVPNWGVSASPIVEEGLLLFNVGGKGQAIVAFDKDDGEIVWKSGSDVAGYSTPIAFSVGGIRQVAVFSGSRLYGVKPGSGDVLWEQPWKTAYDINAATPLFLAPDRLFVSSGQDKGAALFRLEVAEGRPLPRQLWKTDAMQNLYSSSIHVDGSIYGFDGDYLKCLDARTGKDRWRKSGLGHGSLIYADGHMIVLGEEGQLVLVDADPRAYHETASTRLAQRKHWTAPTLYGGRLYVRNERDLLCLELSEARASLKP